MTITHLVADSQIEAADHAATVAALERAAQLHDDWVALAKYKRMVASIDLQRQEISDLERELKTGLRQHRSPDGKLTESPAPEVAWLEAARAERDGLRAVVAGWKKPAASGRELEDRASVRVRLAALENRVAGLEFDRTVGLEERLDGLRESLRGAKAALAGMKAQVRR